MSSRTVWQVLSVKEFFGQNNWQGYLQQAILENQFSQSESSWSCLSVQEFFRRNNWQGQPQIHCHATDSSSLLTLTAREFFQLFAWEGNPEIAALPQIKSYQDITLTSSDDLNLSDLSDLF